MKNRILSLIVATAILLTQFATFTALTALADTTANAPTHKTLPDFIAPIKIISEQNTPSFADWIPVSTREELAAIKNNLSGKFYLTQDIDLSGADWIPLGCIAKPFTGHFDGQGFVIRNMTITETTEHGAVGLFGRAVGKILNVGLEGTNIDIDGGAHIPNYHVYIGGVVGHSQGVGNSYNKGRISVISNADAVSVGGISGYWGYANNSYNTADITVSSFRACVVAGGITSRAGNLYIENSFNTGDITVTSERHEAVAGGVIGEIGFKGNFINCFNTGNISATSNHRPASAGGILGECWEDERGGTVFNSCFNTGDISAQTPPRADIYAFPGRWRNAHAGGIIGYHEKSYRLSGGSVGDVRKNGELTDLFDFSTDELRLDWLVHQTRNHSAARVFKHVSSIDTLAPQFVVGHVLGNAYISVVDALEILKYTVGLESVIVRGNRAFWAARIFEHSDSPDYADALEILKYLVGVKSALYTP